MKNNKEINGTKLNRRFNIALYLIVAVLIVYIISIGKSEKKEIVIAPQENEMTVENPIEQQRVEIIYKDSIVKKEVLKIVEVENPVNLVLLENYQIALDQNDSLKQLQLYKDAITERIYPVVFEDSVQVITTESGVTGRLNWQTVHYKTKERIITMEPEIVKPSLFVGGFSYALFEKPAFGLNLELLNGSQNMKFMIGYDTERRVHFGVGIKIF